MRFLPAAVPEVRDRHRRLSLDEPPERFGEARRGRCHGEMFQTSTSRQPLPVRATTPPTSHPTLHALATFAGTGIGPISGSPGVIGSSQICLGPVRRIRKWPSISLPDLTG